MRLQQLTGPVMAKGLEDTVFYRYFPLASLNEVGGRPSTAPVEIDRFHVFCARRAERWPHGLSATATHDTKRGEDMRARLDVLSEIPRQFLEAVRRWQRMNRRAKPLVDDARVPGSNEEYFIYQTLIGLWPLEALEGDLPADAHEALTERMSAYLLKALREAKVHTSWINVNEPYERACDQFLRRLLARDPAGNPFLADLRLFVGGIASAGLCNALAQLVLKLTVPGVPDLYQGTELWDFSLVDPDNRRPVDYAARRAMLAEVQRLEGDALRARITTGRAHPGDGALKLLVAARTLAHRRRHQQLFETGAYLPLSVEGAHAHHVIGFARVGADGTSSITLAGRFFAALEATGRATETSIWERTHLRLPDELAADRYREVISDTHIAAQPERRSELPLAGILSMLPVAVLEPVRS